MKTTSEWKNAFLGVAVVLILALSSLGCVSTGGPKETWGTLGGAAVGGFLGSQIGSGSGQLAGTALGVLFGAMIGQNIGRQLDERDRYFAGQSAHDAFENTPSGRAREWYNPDTGNSGWTAPTRTYQRSSGQYCREYQTAVTIHGRVERAYGTACREPDGSWEIAN